MVDSGHWAGCVQHEHFISNSLHIHYEHFLVVAIIMLVVNMHHF